MPYQRAFRGSLGEEKKKKKCLLHSKQYRVFYNYFNIGRNAVFTVTAQETFLVTEPREFSSSGASQLAKERSKYFIKFF